MTSAAADDGAVMETNSIQLNYPSRQNLRSLSMNLVLPSTCFPVLIRLPKSPAHCPFYRLSRSELNEFILPCAAQRVQTSPFEACPPRAKMGVRGIRLIDVASLAGALTALVARRRRGEIIIAKAHDLGRFRRSFRHCRLKPRRPAPVDAIERRRATTSEVTEKTVHLNLPALAQRYACRRWGKAGQ